MAFSRMLFVLVAMLSLTRAVAAQEEAKLKRMELTEDACREFADRLIAAIKSGDAETCSTFYDTDAFVDRLFEKLDFRYADRDQARAQWKRQFSDSHCLYANLVSNVRAGGNFRLVRVDPTGPKHLIMRSMDKAGAITYQLYSLSPHGDGQLVIGDAYPIGGASVVDILGTMVAHFTPFEGPDGLIRKDVPDADKLSMDKRALRGMFEQCQKNDCNGVYYFYSRLTSELQLERCPLLLAVHASIVMTPDPSVDATEGKQTEITRSLIERYRNQYPNDPAVDLISVDYFLIAKQYDSAITAIDAVDKFVGGDGYLDALRASVYLMAQDYDRASESAENALVKAADIPQVYPIAADAAVHHGDWDRAINLLDEIYHRFGIVMDPKVLHGPEWRDFLTSPGYLEWNANKKHVTDAPK